MASKNRDCHAPFHSARNDKLEENPRNLQEQKNLPKSEVNIYCLFLKKKKTIKTINPIAKFRIIFCIRVNFNPNKELIILYGSIISIIPTLSPPPHQFQPYFFRLQSQSPDFRHRHLEFPSRVLSLYFRRGILLPNLRKHPR